MRRKTLTASRSVGVFLVLAAVWLVTAAWLYRSDALPLPSPELRLEKFWLFGGLCGGR